MRDRLDFRSVFFYHKNRFAEMYRSWKADKWDRKKTMRTTGIMEQVNRMRRKIAINKERKHEKQGVGENHAFEAGKTDDNDCGGGAGTGISASSEKE